MLRIPVLLALSVSTFARWVSPQPHGCSEVTFDIKATSQNLVFTQPPNPNDTNSIIDFVLKVWRGSPVLTSGSRLTTGSFSISGTYCIPENVESKNTLEILLHGITYNKTVWSGLGFGDTYNWHKHANNRGYATLAIDRLGYGFSSRPDPLHVVQPSMHIEIIHQLTKVARTGSPSPLGAIFGRRFDKVVLVGHSYGSYLGSAVANRYQAEVDALVLTAYSSTIDFDKLITAKWASAGDIDPVRFGGLRKGYIAQANGSERAAAFYSGGFDPAIPAADFAYADTFTDGEFGALGVLLEPAVNYTGPVLVVTAAEDGLTCQRPLSRCYEILEKTWKDNFPNVVDYSFLAPEDTGHDWMLHYSAPETFVRVHDWLEGRV